MALNMPTPIVLMINVQINPPGMKVKIPIPLKTQVSKVIPKSIQNIVVPVLWVLYMVDLYYR